MVPGIRWSHVYDAGLKKLLLHALPLPGMPAPPDAPRAPLCRRPAPRRSRCKLPLKAGQLKLESGSLFGFEGR